MTAVLFCMAMIIEIVYVFMSPVPKELENKYLLIGIAFICAADFTYHIDYTTIKMYVFALLGTIAIPLMVYIYTNVSIYSVKVVLYHFGWQAAL